MAGDGVYRIIAGERRYQAAVAAGLKELPCWVQEPQEKDVLLHQVVENWQRLDLEPMEIATALGAIRDANEYTQKRLAELTGKPETEISRILALLTMSPEAQKVARDDRSGRLTHRHLYEVSKLRPEAQAAILQRIRDERLTVADTATFVARSRPSSTRSTTRRTSTTVTYVTSRAVVRVVFRRPEHSRAEIIEALEEARREAEGKTKAEITIVRPQP